MSRLLKTSFMTAAVWLAVAGASMAQDAPAPSQADTLTPQAVAPQVAGSEWHIFSRSADRAYLVDLGSVAEAAGAKTAQVARVSRKNPAGDYSHSVEGYSLRCSANQVRLGETIEYDATGGESDRFDDGSDWEDIGTGSVDEYVKLQVCDGQRSSSPTYPSIQAFIDAGRGS